MREVKKIETRCTIDGVMFNIGDYLVRIGRYFDRAASDASGLTFEEWTPPVGRDSFIINATELRGVNFTMTPTGELPPLQSELRRSKRAPKAKVTALPGEGCHEGRLGKDNSDAQRPAQLSTLARRCVIPLKSSIAV